MPPINSNNWYSLFKFNFFLNRKGFTIIPKVQNPIKKRKENSKVQKPEKEEKEGMPQINSNNWYSLFKFNPLPAKILLLDVMCGSRSNLSWVSLSYYERHVKIL